jgi:uncharacterized protein
MKLIGVGSIGVALCIAASPAFAQGGSEDAVATRKDVSIMENSFTLGHPDIGYEYSGMVAYAHGDYKRAMKYFLKGAFYADKPSQLSIGLMYLNGEGVKQDPVEAYAWVALSAERKYPKFEETRVKIWQQLTIDQRNQALALEQSLYQQYGDLSAKPRQVKAMHDSWVEMFKYGGPGFIDGSDMYTSQGSPKCESDSVRVCSDIYAKWFWQPKEYFSIRDAVWTGNVTVGPLQNARKDSGVGPQNDGDSSPD